MTNKPQQCEHQGKKYINKESTLSHLQNGTEYGKMKNLRNLKMPTKIEYIFDYISEITLQHEFIFKIILKCI